MRLLSVKHFYTASSPFILFLSFATSYTRKVNQNHSKKPGRLITMSNAEGYLSSRGHSTWFSIKTVLLPTSS